jgi:hypothetical protein
MFGKFSAQLNERMGVFHSSLLVKKKKRKRFFSTSDIGARNPNYPQRFDL